MYYTIYIYEYQIIYYIMMHKMDNTHNLQSLLGNCRHQYVSI